MKARKAKAAGFSLITLLCFSVLLVPTVLVGLAACGADGGMSGGSGENIAEYAR